MHLPRQLTCMFAQAKQEETNFSKTEPLGKVPPPPPPLLLPDPFLYLRREPAALSHPRVNNMPVALFYLTLYRY